jgi:mRNA-degrading endonuclease RelE of RelBE toxin-antitoxin system
MADDQKYQLVLSSFAEQAYFEALVYVFEHYALQRANEIAIALLSFPEVLKTFPHIGSIESYLTGRSQEYRFLVFERANLKSIKIIYYIDADTKTVYITDFFPCEMSESKIKNRIT